MEEETDCDVDAFVLGTDDAPTLSDEELSGIADFDHDQTPKPKGLKRKQEGQLREPVTRSRCEEPYKQAKGVADVVRLSIFILLLRFVDPNYQDP